MNRRLTTVMCAALTALASPAYSDITTAPGFQNAFVTAAPAGAFTGGMDFLPSGNMAIFDGANVVECDPSSGNIVSILHAPSTTVFGSFVRTSIDGTFLLFGESSFGDIIRIPLDGSPSTVVANIPFNYACVFQSNDVAFITRPDSTWSNTYITRLDISSGVMGDIALVPGASGPVAFDESGNLYYGENSSAWPAPQGSQSIYRWSAVQVANAGRGSILTPSNGIVFAGGQTAPSSLAFDEEGDLLVSDSIDGVIYEIGNNGLIKGTIGSEAQFNSVTAITFIGNGNDKSQFGFFQPESGGTLYAISTDWFSFNHLNAIRPERSTLSTTPQNPIPAGASFSFFVHDGPPNATVLLLIGSAGQSPETYLQYQGVAQFIGVSGQIVTATLALDSSGSLHIPAVNAGLGGISISVQGALFDPQKGPVGTTEALQIDLN